jgi:uncharacterized membrane protein
MADPRPDRHAYLAFVADRLALPGLVAQDVLDELEAHIADSSAGLIEEGLDPDRAEREALARLGDPGELGDEIRRAKQTRRRLLAAAGYGALAAVNGFIWGWIFAAAITVLGLVIAALVVSVIVQALGITTSSPGFLRSGVSFPFVTFALGYAGHRVPAVMAARSLRRPEVFRRPVALVGGVAIGIVSIFWLRTAIDPATLVTLLLAPFAFATGALLDLDTRVGASGRIRISARTVLVAVAVTALASSILALATMQVNPPDGASRNTDTTEPIGPTADGVLPEGTVTLDGWSIGGIVGRELGFDPSGIPAGWTGFRLEAWREGPWVDGAGPILTGETAPAASAPMQTTTDLASLAGRLTLPATKADTTYSIAITGLAPDGRRYVLSGPDTGLPGPAWVGTAWEWLTTP